MSTKTTFKRIALVAVAALGLSLVSVAPSSAAVSADTYTLSETTTTVTLGTAASTTLTTAGYFAATSDTVTVTAALKTFPSTATAAQVSAAISSIAFSAVDTQTAVVGGSAGGSSQVASGATVSVGVDGAAPKLVSTRSKLTVTPTAIGTYTYSLTPSGGSNTTAVTWTVVVTARPALTVAGSTVHANYAYYNDAVNVASRGAWTAWSATTDALTLSAFAAPGNAPHASIKVVQGNGSTTSPLLAADALALTATVTSGPGLVAITGDGDAYDANAPKGAFAISTAAQVTSLGLTQYVYIYSTGVPGLVTVEIKAGTTVLSTEKINFYGVAAKITPTVVNSVLAIGANAGAVTAVVADASGNPVPGVRVYAVSDTTATIDSAYVASVAVSDATGKVTFDLTGKAAGTAGITLTLNSASTGTSTVSAVAGTMRVSDGVVTKVDYAFDKESYAPGETAKITATVSNAAGVMPAGTYTVLATGGVTANYAVTGLPTTTVLAVASTGKATYTVTIPVGITGDLQLIGTASATTIAATFGKAAVVNAALDQAVAATDAATEAYDAATAATDAANEAAAAADAATAAAQDAADAVAALSTQVTEQIAELKAQNAALRKQITALTNLIIKIQKKVKA
jgi:hypothetical protein